MIDLTRLEELRIDFGSDGLQDLMPVFIEEIEGAILKLKTQSGADDIAMTAHFIKGSAANLGLSDLARLCGELETSAEDGTSVGDLKQRISDIFDQSILALNAEI